MHAPTYRPIHGLLVVGAFCALSTPALANITDVRASSSGVINLRPSATTLPSYTGSQGDLYLSDSKGYGAGFDGTTLITPTSIFFENGTMAAGSRNRAKAVTEVEIDFFNSTGSAGLPGLQSVIFPASFGFYVSDFQNCAGVSLPSCSEVSSGPGFSGFRNNAPRNPNLEIAGVSFKFDVLSDGVVSRSIGGKITILRDSLGNIKFVEDFGSGSNALPLVLQNFSLNSVPDYSYVYSWDEGDFYTSFGSLLAAGATRTVTFRITTESWSNSQALFSERFRSEIVAFSGFADPLGRGGNTGVAGNVNSLEDWQAASSSGIPGVTFTPFQLGLPRYQNGVIVFTPPATGDGGGGGGEGGGGGPERARGALSDFALASFNGVTPGVPEPGTWAMIILGFGIVGLSVRRRKPVAAAKVTA